MTALVIVFGFVFLLLGAEGLVDGASGLAKCFGISNLVIGMTVVAFGTSMPEFVVNMLSVVEGHVSADKQFVSLRLYLYEQIDYRPASKTYFLQGEAAQQAVRVFKL